MNKNMSEYDGLRNEIISMEEQQRNVWIHMYVLFIALFVLGIEWSYYLFLVTYVVLIPFQVVINRYNWSITKISTYIRLFYEKDDKDLKWESLHVFPEYKKYYKSFNGSLIGKIRYTGVSQLAFLSTGFYIFYSLCNNYNKGMFSIDVAEIIFIIVALVLLFIAIMLNKEYNKSYVDELEDIIQKYKNS